MIFIIPGALKNGGGGWKHGGEIATAHLCAPPKSLAPMFGSCSCGNCGPATASRIPVDRVPPKGKGYPSFLPREVFDLGEAFGKSPIQPPVNAQSLAGNSYRRLFPAITHYILPSPPGFGEEVGVLPLPPPPLGASARGYWLFPGNLGVEISGHTLPVKNYVAEPGRWNLRPSGVSPYRKGTGVEISGDCPPLYGSVSRRRDLPTCRTREPLQLQGVKISWPIVRSKNFSDLAHHPQAAVVRCIEIATFQQPGPRPRPWSEQRSQSDTDLKIPFSWPVLESEIASLLSTWSKGGTHIISAF